MWNVIIIFFFFFFSCTPVEQKEVGLAKKKIVSTTAQIGDLVSSIGGDRIESIVLVRGELNPHSYELVKGDGEKIKRAQIVFYNGLGLEHGASVSSVINSHPNKVGIGEEIARLHPDRILKREETVDPHIWMDVSLWKEAVDPIADHLSEIDPEGEAEYRQRAGSLKAEMTRVDLEIYGKLQGVPKNRRYLVTSHDAFQYFARRYLAEDGENNWEKRFAAPEGLSPDGQLSIADLRSIVDHLKEHQITIIFPESNVNRDSLKKIADMTHVRICKKALFGDSIRGGYLSSMLHNGETLAEELSQ